MYNNKIKVMNISLNIMFHAGDLPSPSVQSCRDVQFARLSLPYGAAWLYKKKFSYLELYFGTHYSSLNSTSESV